MAWIEWKMEDDHADVYPNSYVLNGRTISSENLIYSLRYNGGSRYALCDLVADALEGKFRLDGRYATRPAKDDRIELREETEHVTHSLFLHREDAQGLVNTLVYGRNGKRA